MFGIPGKSPVTITPSAERQIVRLMAGKQAYGLRIGLKKGGCAGMEYTMDLAQSPDKADEVVEQGEARVLIAPMAQMFLFGTEIDYESGLIESGFRFRNPNVTDACGCGESVRFEPLEGSRTAE
ncbi:MAG: iron-sulfur cluster assembly accessory protein [Paracoccus sp. (in: a-proteobacteria)]|jgi:iron-sulfur cluster assembly protein|uniref:HesB/IscA family protein n=1 Tax=unclassified Paracoccus (in: a-proteobacteria) TaxID=2688777 RepID=UPI000C5541A9|nr:MULTISPECIES: iron-sulfur cluster assembly accessory protein [unclassified Paracoccus (in: a-proteobacteria)]MAN55061.1 Fe-S cluster assembly protein HesB [Paracoccus sp. (in: a-proteobacteria)]MBA50179.1 Fe-S cluster assembly protein HesB [Paracoccus sp. (in: a-proteobacteria)]MCS5601502.1 iron-sulfur cluster assembly accessory protein [Paracoccus sp. (in: a-proteobacteria)]MDB2552416.1 iron-sulfur cluster assembly accessory protein [Paracoccus sp. (in: a-proteobacteria)]HIC67134.1 iron-su|tara:strand:+ start:913 stop:1284 length:372 start_codon:yes stop_codon:yes gene_type:complete